MRAASQICWRPAATAADLLPALRSSRRRLLLHSETASGSVVPVWEDAEEASVASVREIMADAGDAATDLDLVFKRLPMTSERPPDSNDLRELMRLVINTDWDTTVVVLNDQLGRGRVRLPPPLPPDSKADADGNVSSLFQSTVASVILLLTQAWLRRQRTRASTASPLEPVATHEEEDAVISGESIVQRTRPTRQHSVGKSRAPSKHASRASAMSWQVINNLLRVIRNGLEVKQAVDDAIDQAGQGINLRDCIEESRGQSRSLVRMRRKLLQCPDDPAPPLHSSRRRGDGPRGQGALHAGGHPPPSALLRARPLPGLPRGAPA